MRILDFVLLHVVLVSGLMNSFVNGLENQTYILCTSISSWPEAMDTCLNEGGRPLTYDDIKMTNLSEKIDLKVWTAEYTTISNQKWNSSIGRDLLRDTVCGIQTIHIDKVTLGSVINKITDIKYKNCTEQQAYVCDRGQDPSTKNHMHPYVYLNETTWINAVTSCKSQNRRLLTVNQLDSGKYIPVDPELSESMTLDVWIGLLASLDFRVKTEKGPLKSDNIITCGTFSNSAGYRMIDGYLPDQFTALCGFGSSMSVDTSLFNYCLEDTSDTSSLHTTMTSLDVIFTGNMTLETPNGNPESIENIPWLELAVIVSCGVLGVIISGSVAISLYKKRRREEIRMVDGPMANNSSRDYDYARGEEFNVAAVESRNGDAYSLASEPGVPETHTVSNPMYELHQVPTSSVPDDDNMYDTTDGRNKKRSQEGQVELHIYDRANYSNGKLLYDNRM